MGFDVAVAIIRSQVCTLCISLTRQPGKILWCFVSRFIESQLKEMHICSCSFDVFFDFIPQLLIFEESIPETVV